MECGWRKEQRTLKESGQAKWRRQTSIVETGTVDRSGATCCWAWKCSSSPEPFFCCHAFVSYHFNQNIWSCKSGYTRTHHMSIFRLKKKCPQAFSYVHHMLVFCKANDLVLATHHSSASKKPFGTLDRLSTLRNQVRSNLTREAHDLELPAAG